MIEAIPVSAWFNDFEFRQNGRVVGELESPRLWRRGAAVVAGQRYRLQRTGPAERTFVMSRDGKVLARAVRAPIQYDFEIELSARRLELRNTSFAERRLNVFDGDAQVGNVRHDGPDPRRTQIALPSNWPVHEQIFVFWLAMYSWERMGASEWG